MEDRETGVLLEKIEDNTRRLAEGLVMTNERLDRMEARADERFLQFERRMDRMEANTNERSLQSERRMDRMEANTNERFDRVESTLLEVKTDVRDIKRTMGLLQSIAGDHETRLQAAEAR